MAKQYIKFKKGNNSVQTYTSGTIDDLLTAKVDNSTLADYQPKGSYATLDSQGKVPSSQLPSYVDDVLECNNFSALPAEGETGKIYVTIDNNKTYRWTGTQYTEISASLALGETTDTAFYGNQGKNIKTSLGAILRLQTSGSNIGALADGATYSFNFETDSTYYSSTDPVKSILNLSGSITPVSSAFFLPVVESVTNSSNGKITDLISGKQLVEKLTNIKTDLDKKAYLATSLSEYGITDAYTKAQVDSLLAEQAGVLQFDDTPTMGSSKLVKSGGIYTALSKKADVTTWENSTDASGNITTTITLG